MKKILITLFIVLTASVYAAENKVRLDPETSKDWKDVFVRISSLNGNEFAAGDDYYYERYPEVPKNYSRMTKTEDNWYTFEFEALRQTFVIQFSNGSDRTEAVKTSQYYSDPRTFFCFALQSTTGGAIKLDAVDCPIDAEIGKRAYTLDILNKKAMLKNYLYDEWQHKYTGLDYTKLTGDLTIRSTVSYNSEKYTVVGIQGGTFYECVGLTSITIPNTVSYIGMQNFSYCSGLTSISLPNTLTEILFETFLFCTGLKNMTIPDGVKLIEAEAFAGCSGLESVTIPNSITKIEYEAFYACGGLKSITCEATTPPLCGENVFEGETGYPGVNKTACVLFVPENSVEAYKKADTWKEFYRIVPIGTVITDIEEVHPSTNNGEVHKILRNGQILILRGDKVYTIQGQVVE